MAPKSWYSDAEGSPITSQQGKDSEHDRGWRILIVDDHPVVRAGLACLIRNEPDLSICGEAAEIRAALPLIAETSPDLAVIDLSLADGNGLELIKRLKAHHPDLRMLVCSMHDEALFAQRSLNAGAMGYINKHEATTHIVDAIRRVLSGKIWLSETMTERVLLGITDHGTPSEGTSIDRLSDRELEVFLLIGQGLGPTQIAEQLHISVKTVETHREKIKRKLNLQSGSELNRRAMQWVLEES